MKSVLIVRVTPLAQPTSAQQLLMYVLPYGSPDPPLIGITLAVTCFSENAKVIFIQAVDSNHVPSSVISLLIRGHPGAIVKHAATRFQRQGQLLEEAKRDLAEMRRNVEVYKALYIAECDRRDLEQEKRALKDEIHELKERSMHGREEKFEQEQRALNDGILQLKVILFPCISCVGPSVFRVSLHKWFSQKTAALTVFFFSFSNQAIATREKRAAYQQKPPPVSPGTLQHARVREGSKVT